MKEFWIYTGLRLGLFVASLVVVGGAWLAVADSANVMWVLVISLVLSGVASYFLLGHQRGALARNVDARAKRATAMFDEIKAKEDAD